LGISQKYKYKFERLIELQERVKNVHPLMNKFYPIAIVEAGSINIFDYNTDCKEYKLEHQERDSMNIPKGVRAAFPLEFYDNRSVVVVSEEIFDTIADQIMIFHECVHCYQFETCEIKLRAEIELAKNSVNTDDYFWELHYPFPYDDPNFVDYVGNLFKHLNKNEKDEICKLRKDLKIYLTKEQVEYMVWQEWKEGFARYIENIIKRELGIIENHFGINQPFTRSLFYETGARLSEFIVNRSIDSLQDIEQLYYIMNEDKW
jgi:hypothetical protein